MEFGLIIVGDEILSGRRRDGHLTAVIERLNARGLGLDWCRIVGDREDHLVATLRETMATGASVFCCGGIGATPDDVTRQAAASAAGVALARHPEGEALLRARFGDSASDLRLRMVDFPAGAELIPNPVNQVPGFRVGEHHFVPGFPDMAWPMIEWVLDTRYQAYLRTPRATHSIRVVARESDLIPLLERLGRDHPEVRFSSLPDMSGSDYAVELGVTGAPEEAGTAQQALAAELDAAGVQRA